MWMCMVVSVVLPRTSCAPLERIPRSVDGFLDVLGPEPRPAMPNPRDKVPPDKLAGSALLHAMEPFRRFASGVLESDVPDQAHLSVGIQESATANILVHKAQLRTPTTSSPTETSEVMVIVQSLMLLVSLGCFLFTLFVGLRLQMFNPHWEHLQSASWIGFGVAISLYGQICSLLSNHIFHRSAVHLPPWMARCAQDECIGLLTLAYLLRIETWRKAWLRLQPYSKIYEQVHRIPRAGHCAPSTMLFAALAALLLLALNIPVGICFVWLSSTLWPHAHVPAAPDVVHGVDLFFPYAVLGLSACLILSTLTSIRLMHDNAHELCHEIWLSCAVLGICAIFHIAFDGSWLLTYNAFGKHATGKSAELPVFREEVTAIWCIALHLNMLITTFFLWQCQAHCQPLPRPFDATKFDALLEPSPLGTMKLEHELLDPESP